MGADYEMEMLELLDRIAPKDEKRSRVEVIRDMYLSYQLTLKQRRAIELFLFKPTKKQAFKAMDITPKAWLFIRYAVSEAEIVARVSDMIVQGKVNGTYIRVITMNEALKDLLEKLLDMPCGDKLKRYIKKCEMVKKLKK